MNSNELLGNLIVGKSYFIDQLKMIVNEALYAQFAPGAKLLPGAKLHPGVNLNPLMKRSYVNKLCSYVIGFAL